MRPENPAVSQGVRSLPSWAGDHFAEAHQISNYSRDISRRAYLQLANDRASVTVFGNNKFRHTTPHPSM